MASALVQLEGHAGLSGIRVGDVPLRRPALQHQQSVCAPRCLAWYQTDLNADAQGTAQATIETILLDQIFGFVSGPNNTALLPPTNTFHVGFWFNSPEDAASCGFDPAKPTPFNGEHKAGPLAMISLPDRTTGLGPLCTSPTGASPDAPSPQACNP